MQLENDRNTQDGINIDFLDLIRDLLKSWWLILIAGLIAYMVMYMGVQYTYKPRYTSSTTLAITMGGTESYQYGNIMATTSLAEIFTNISNNEVLQLIIADTMGESVLPGNITASAVPETNFLIVNAEAETPKLAYDIMKATIESFSEISQYVDGSPVIQIMESAEYPNHPSNYVDAKDRASRAFKLGALFMAALIVIASYMKDTIKNIGDINKKLDTTLLGVIYHENKYKTLKSWLNKQKTGVLMTNPSVSFYFVEAYKKLRTKLEYRLKDKNMKVIMISSVSENEGKSTVAANIAISLAQKGSIKVLLIDGDVRKPSVHKLFKVGIHRNVGIEEYLLGKRSCEEVIIPSFISNLDIVTGKKGREDSTELVGSEKMEALIMEARKKYDFIIIDSPPMSLLSDAEVMLPYCDGSIIVVRQSSSLAIDINDAIHDLSGQSGKFLGCIFNNAWNSSMLTMVKDYGYGAYYYRGNNKSNKEKLS